MLKPWPRRVANSVSLGLLLPNRNGSSIHHVPMYGAVAGATTLRRDPYGACTLKPSQRRLFRVRPLQIGTSSLFTHP